MQVPAENSLSASSAGPERLNLAFLDGMRALAAIIIVLHHGWYTVWNGSDPPLFWTQWLSNGHTVSVFMVISGYCLMLPVVRGDGTLRHGAVAFWRKRAARILPPYYFAVAFSLLLDTFLLNRKMNGLWDSCLPITWDSVVVHLLLLQNFSSSQIHTINYAFWSLSLEWWIYFLFPGLVWAWKRFSAGATAAFLVVISYAAWLVCGKVLHNDFTLNFIGFFVLGMFASELAHSRRPAILFLRERFSWEKITWVVLALLLIATTGKVRHFSSGYLLDLLIALCTLCFLVMLSLRQDNFAGKFLSQKPLTFLGSFAYSIYLVHSPLIQIIWQYVLYPLHFAPTLAFLLLALGGVPVVLAGTYLFHLAFERPFATNLPLKPRSAHRLESCGARATSFLLSLLTNLPLA